jgi:hypothetical protein
LGISLLVSCDWIRGLVKLATLQLNTQACILYPIHLQAKTSSEEFIALSEKFYFVNFCIFSMLEFCIKFAFNRDPIHTYTSKNYPFVSKTGNYLYCFMSNQFEIYPLKWVINLSCITGQLRYYIAKIFMFFFCFKFSVLHQYMHFCFCIKFFVTRVVLQFLQAFLLLTSKIGDYFKLIFAKFLTECVGDVVFLKQK